MIGVDKWRVEIYVIFRVYDCSLQFNQAYGGIVYYNNYAAPIYSEL